MNRTKFTLEDIEQFLKTEYGFDWVNRQIKSNETKDYQTAKLSDFNSNPVELVLCKKGITYNRDAIIDWDTFELIGPDNDVNMSDNRSGVWQEMLYKNHSLSRSVKKENLTLVETVEYLKEYLQSEYDTTTWVGGMVYDQTINKCRKVNRLDLQDSKGVDLVIWNNNKIIKKHVVISDLIDDAKFISFVKAKRKELEGMLSFQ